MRRLSDSELAERTGLRTLANRLLYQGVRAGVSAGQQARSRFAAARELIPTERLARPEPPAAFDLTLTEEQALMRETLRRFALDTMRAAAPAADRGALDPDYLAQLSDLALETVAIPEALGGVAIERSPVANVLIAEDLAYGDMGLALAALAPLGLIHALSEFATREQMSRYLPAFTGDAHVDAALALHEPHARFDAHRLATVAVRDGVGYRLRGAKCLVPLVERAELFGVFAELAGEGPRLFLVEAEAPGLRRVVGGHMGLGAAGLGRLELEGVHVDASALVGGSSDGDTPAYDHARAIDLARLGLCALALGTAQAVLDHVTRYCNDRVAFGEPVSHRQAVAFAIADIAIELEGMRLLTYRAASRAERGDSFHREAALARIQCAEKGMQIGSQGVQLLGGHGFVCEHPVERWYRQLRAIAVLEGALLV
ncbi:MAG: acyl-CoA dehydrogenase family protein [Myxococcales bacterium]|nr:acyl-CoA dehydrogenase family protein [Myxococcales bacterium]